MRKHIALLALAVTALAVFGVPLEARRSETTVAAPPGIASEAAAPAVVVVDAEPGTYSSPTAAVPGPGMLVPPPAAPPPTGRGVEPPATDSAAVLLLDDASGAVLYERNGYRPLPPASLTKIATAIVAIQRGALDATVEVDVDGRLMRGSTVMGLEPGDQFTLRDLLYGLMLPSGNDAALAIGRHIAGSDPAFVELMNALATRLNLRQTHFVNPHGLGGATHATSAYDLARLSRYAMTLPVYREIAGADHWVARGSREITLYSLVTEERWSIPGVDAVKSGYTRTAGRTLALTAQRDGRRLHVVVFNDPHTESVAAGLLEWGFANFEWPGATAVAAMLASEPAP